MKDGMREMLVLAGISLGSTALIWLPFFFGLSDFWGMQLPRDGMAAVVRNYDGPYYIVVAKSLYNPEVIKQFEFGLPVEYYAAHYPLYPLLIRALGPLISFPYAVLGTTVLFSVLAVWMFYWLARELKMNQAFGLSVIFLILPARWLVVRSVGSPEPVFLFWVLLSIWGMIKKNYWVAGIAGALAQLTKSPGILLFASYGLYLGWQVLSPQHWKEAVVRKNGQMIKGAANWWKSLPWKAYPLWLIPVTLLGVWWWYGQVLGSFWAYFQSGDNIHLFWPPFQMFNKAAAWVGTFWLEDIVWVLLLGALGVIWNWKRQDVISWFSLVWYLSILFVSHRDVARYALPLMPFLILAFAPVLEKKEFRYALMVVLLPIYLYAVNFIAGNTIAISDWGRLL